MNTSNWVEVARDLPDISTNGQLADFKLRIERPLRDIKVPEVRFVAVVPTYQNDGQVRFQFSVVAESPAEAYRLAELQVDTVLDQVMLRA